MKKNKLQTNLILSFMIVFLSFSSVYGTVNQPWHMASGEKSMSQLGGVLLYAFDLSKNDNLNNITANLISKEYQYQTNEVMGNITSGTAHKASEYWNTKNIVYEPDKMYRYFNTAKEKKGGISALYPKAITYKGRDIDVKVTIVDWGKPFKKSAAGEIPPLVSLRVGKLSTIDGKNVAGWGHQGMGYMANMPESVTYKYEFFEAGTSKRANIKAVFGYEDLDGLEGAVLSHNGKEKFYINSDFKGNAKTNIRYKNLNNEILINGGYPAIDRPNIPEDSMAWLFEGSEFTATSFINRKKMKNFDEWMSKGSGKTYSKLKSKFMWGGMKIVQGNLLGYENELTPEKFIKDGDKEVKSKTVDKKEKWKYIVKTGPIPEEKEINFYKSFEVADEIDKCLKIEKIRVIDEEEKDRTAEWQISKNENSIKAKANTVKKEFYGHSYGIEITVSARAEEKELKEHGHFNSDKIKIGNDAVARADFADGKGIKEKKTDRVIVIMKLPDDNPDIDIKKSTNTDKCKVGDEVDYEVIVGLSKGEKANNVVIRDESLPKEVKIIDGSVKVSGARHPETRMTDKGFVVTIPELTKEEKTKIQYKAKVLDFVKEGNDIENIAQVKSDETAEKEDSAKIRIEDKTKKDAPDTGDNNASAIVFFVLVSASMIGLFVKAKAK